MEVERHLFCIFNLFSVLNFKIFGRVEGFVAQTIVWRGRSLGIRGELAKPEVQSILYKTYLSRPSAWWIVCCLCNVLGRSRVCVCYAWEIFPTLTCLFKQKEIKWKQTRALPVWSPGSQNFIIIIKNILFYFILCVFLFVHLTFHTQARLR
jgi:hypothetical protein